VGKANIRIVDLDEAVARRVIAVAITSLLPKAWAMAPISTRLSGAAMVNVEIWEAPPSVLFSGGLSNLGASASSSGHSQITEQTVDGEGAITIPFVGRVKAAGRSPAQLGRDINAALTGKAHDPQTLVKVTRPASTSVTVIGEVAASARVPLSPRERLLDVLASVGGTRQQVNKMTIQLARGGHIVSMPLEAVITDPQQNIRLQPDDVVTALYQPFSFTALGATGRSRKFPSRPRAFRWPRRLGGFPACRICAPMSRACSFFAWKGRGDRRGGGRQGSHGPSDLPGKPA
jgi:polysaccharide export outer membrane protein